jgi:hypothetical protein
LTDFDQFSDDDDDNDLRWIHNYVSCECEYSGSNEISKIYSAD